MVAVGARSVTPRVASTGHTTCDMYTFQAWRPVVLGSWKELVPYQTESERPAPPATIQGNTFTFDGARLTCTGFAHCVQLVAALATVVKTWYVLVVPLTDPVTANVT